MVTHRRSSIESKGEFRADSELVILEPETWGSKRYLILRHIDIGSNLTEGK